MKKITCFSLLLDLLILTIAIQVKNDLNEEFKARINNSTFVFNDSSNKTQNYSLVNGISYNSDSFIIISGFGSVALLNKDSILTQFYYVIIQRHFYNQLGTGIYFSLIEIDQNINKELKPTEPILLDDRSYCILITSDNQTSVNVQFSDRFGRFNKKRIYFFNNLANSMLFHNETIENKLNKREC
jgi:hypothetical protein